MGIPVEIPGLDSLIPEVADGEVVVVESEGDMAKSFFIRRLVLSALRLGRPTVFITSRSRGEVLQQLELKDNGGSNGSTDAPPVTIQESEVLTQLVDVPRDTRLLAIDSFSFLTMELSPERLSGVLRELRERGRRDGTVSLLAIDRGMLSARSEAIAAHLADDVLNFHGREGTEGLVRYMRIPKWGDGRLVDRNIYYDFDGRRLAVDLRNRVL